MAGKKRLPTDERRAQLLKLGRSLFGQRPYDEISIDDIAERLGISKGLLYHYFPSKRRFYVESLRAAAEELERLTEPRATGPSPEGLRASLDAFLDYVEQHATGYRALLRGGVGHDRQVAAILDGVRQTIADRIVRVLGIGRPPPLVRLALRGWIGFVEAASLDWVEQHDLPRVGLRELLAETLAYALSISASARQSR
jgi:AcrR family transcriptional regulator